MREEMVDPMNTHVPLSRAATILSLLAVLAVMVAGCTQLAPSQPAQQAPVTAVQPDDNHITIAFHGGPGMDNLVELEITITDSAGKSVTQSRGSRLATTPIRTDSTTTFTGSFTGKDHVVISGYFMDGSHRTVLDTTL
jgi:hypothetical protein